MSVTPWKVFIIDDQTILRNLIAILLRHDQRFRIVGEAADAAGALEQAYKLAPDIAIVDYSLPDATGVELVKKLKPKLHKCRFLVFSAHQKVGVVKEVLEAGAHGFIEKSATLEDFREALLAVAEGRTYLGPATQKLMAADNGAASALVKSISPREREVLKLIVEGMSTKQIANALKISFKTADNHRANLMKKLGVHDVVTLTRKAVKLGLALVE